MGSREVCVYIYIYICHDELYYKNSIFLHIVTEFQRVVTSDESRRQRFLCCLAHSDNPARKFEWGNLITLRDNIGDDDLYEAVHEFRKRHYSSHRMTLVIQVV